MINKVLISGYLGKYVKTGTTNKGNSYASFQLSQYTGDPNNKYQYVPLVAFDGEKIKPATRIAQAQQGDFVVVEAHVKAEKKREGDQNRTEVSLVVDSIKDVITPVPHENRSPMAQNKPVQANYQQSTPTGWNEPRFEITESDLPF